MGSSYLFTRQRVLKMVIFTGCALTIRIAFISLGYPKGTKFSLESKASFIDISSIASVKLSLIAWLREYWSFLDSHQSTLDENSDLQRLLFQMRSINWDQTYVLKRNFLNQELCLNRSSLFMRHDILTGATCAPVLRFMMLLYRGVFRSLTVQTIESSYIARYIILLQQLKTDTFS